MGKFHAHQHYFRANGQCLMCDWTYAEEMEEERIFLEKQRQDKENKEKFIIQQVEMEF